ncbi:AAA family ATPase [Psychrobacillus sp.]|uniref:AAA family ATPase n=1 Tax=Psychrobacillus sp. TaxID=1871623 RepID=UPI0028BDAC39|nr:AAA family ATPase [Psychrobacillus sp.]
MTRKVFIISGPAGVGKSTTSKILAQQLVKSAHISGDTISYMPVSGYEKPWLSEQAKDLVWNNIVSLSNNFLDAGYDVIIDWVAFWEDVQSYATEWIVQGIEVKYVILWADADIHVSRDLQRAASIQMGERVLILRDEFLSSGAPAQYFLDNSSDNPENIFIKIVEDPQFLLFD